MNNQDYNRQLNALREFLLDIDCLESLNNYRYGVNFFEVSGMVNKEIHHSKVLSWILDANANHGLGDKVIKKFLQRVIKKHQNICDMDIIEISLIDFTSFIVRTEYLNIDILLVSNKNVATEGTVVIIENKVYAYERIDGEDGGQLKNYLDSVKVLYPNYKIIPIFLTLEGNLPSDTEHWLVADYSLLIDVIGEVISGETTLSSESRMLLEQYVKMVRRHLILDKKLQEICKQIYAKHKEALDLIYEYRPDVISNISDTIKAFLASNASEHKLIIDTENNGKTYIRFVTEYIQNILPQLATEKFGWQNGWRFMYEVECGVWGVDIRGYIDKADDAICKKIYEYSQQEHKKYGITRRTTMPAQWARTWRFPLLSKEDVAKFEENEVHDKLTKRLKESLQRIDAYEQDLKDNIII